MSGALEFDTANAASAARSWSNWGDHLNRASHALALDLDHLRLDGVASAACEHLGAAATHLWTAAAFTDTVRSKVSSADGRLTVGPRSVDRLLAEVAAAVARSAGGRAADGRRWAELEWLRSASAAEVRRHFAGIGAVDPAEVLARLFGEEAALYWNALGAADQAALASTRPDLVVLHALPGGADLSGDLLELLDAANAFGTFTSSLGIDVGVSIGLKVIQLEIGGGVALTLTKMSDGRVEMLLVEGAHLGGGQDLSAPDAGSAGWAVGGAVEFQQKFAFDDEMQAASAIATLRAALAQDVSLGEISTDLFKGSFNQLAAVVNAPSDVWNLTNRLPILDRLPDAPSVPTFDLTPEVAKALQQLWSDHGLEQVEAVGAYASASADFDAAIAEMSVGATASVMYYDRDGRAGSAGRGRTGVVVAGGVELDGAADQRGAATANFAVDIHQADGDGMEMTLFLGGQVGGGATAELFELGSAELGSHHDRTLEGTIEMVVPIDDLSDVVPLVTLLGAGVLPVDDIRRLYERSEISVTLRNGSGTAATFEFEAGVISVDATAEHSEADTVVALHKYPGGDMHDQFELDRIISRRRGG